MHLVLSIIINDLHEAVEEVLLEKLRRYHIAVYESFHEFQERSLCCLGLLFQQLIGELHNSRPYFGVFVCSHLLRQNDESIVLYLLRCVVLAL